MSEMLGNQYFMARKFDASVPEFEEALSKTPKSKMIRKKLIICYTQIGQINKAFQLFHSLIKEDIAVIIETDVIADDCPCPELVTKLSSDELTADTLDNSIKLGILWLYCDSSNSLVHFEKASTLNPDEKLISSTINLIKAYLKNNIKSEIKN